MRPLQKRPRITPGPGSYNLRQEFGSGQAVVWKPKKQYLRIEDLVVMPGPGTYDIKSTIPQMQDYEKVKMENRGLNFY